MKSDRSVVVAYFITSDSVVPSDSKQLSQTLLVESIQSPHVNQSIADSEAYYMSGIVNK